jgi:hypothetical protein
LVLAAFIVLLSLSVTTVSASNEDGVQWLPGQEGNCAGDPGGPGNDGTGDPDEVFVLVVPPDQIEFYTSPVVEPNARHNRTDRSVFRTHDLRYILNLFLSMR